MSALPSSAAVATATVLAYHEHSKHRLDRYAAGPDTLDWDAQPDPFRRFAGAPLTQLPLPAEGERTRWTSLFSPGAIAPHAATLESLGLLFELSFALSAWKEWGPDRWAVRCNPSSGNLHPTEVYLLVQGLAELDDGLYHYAPREHALEQRARFPQPTAHAGLAPRLLIGLSSIHWREAWKYGERAFRYCQLDLGHALGALRYAAAVLGWRVQELGLTHGETASMLGLDRAQDFANAEREEVEGLFALCLGPAEAPFAEPGEWLSAAPSSAASTTPWSGQANRLDPHPMYRWPVIDAVAQASRRTVRLSPASLPPIAQRALLPDTAQAAAQLIRTRRSAQRFDRRARLDARHFWPLAAALMPSSGDQGGAPIPWDMGGAPSVHAVVFAHRIDGLEPGAYLLPRNAAAQPALQAALPHLAWSRVVASPQEVPLYTLALNPALAGTLRTLSCHQAIAADAVFVVALLAEFRPELQDAPWRYRELLREAGLIGQVLYLEAEAIGLRGTGIGCYFDDPVHALLGLPTPSADPAALPSAQPPAHDWQVLYHFSVGLPVTDERITSSPPYPKVRP